MVQIFKYNILLLSSLLYHHKLNIFGFRTAGQRKPLTVLLCAMFFSFFIVNNQWIRGKNNC